MPGTITILRKGSFDGGYFVLREHVLELPYPSLSKLYTTGEEQCAIKETVHRLVSNSKRYLKVCSFILEDKAVVKAILELLLSNVAVFILTALDERALHAYLEREEEPTTQQTHLENIALLAKAGAHVRACIEAHAKFVISDGSEAILMSANLTRLSMRMNPESGVCIASSMELENLEQLFDSIFQFGTEYDSFVSIGKRELVVNRRENLMQESYLPIRGSSNLRWTYGLTHLNLLSDIEMAFEGAKKDILLSSYSVVALDRLPKLMENIKTFLDEKKGRLSILVRGMNHRPDHLEACGKLTELGAKIFGDLYNHSKTIVSDNGNSLLFTANIDGKIGLTRGFEVGISVVPESEEAADIRTFLRWQLDTAPFEFRWKPDKQELFDLYDFVYHVKKVTPPAIPDEAVILLPPNVLSRAEVAKMPTTPLYIQRQANGFVLQMSGKYFHLNSISENEFELQAANNSPLHREEFIWQYKKLELRIQ